MIPPAGRNRRIRRELLSVDLKERREAVEANNEILCSVAAAKERRVGLGRRDFNPGRDRDGRVVSPIERIGSLDLDRSFPVEKQSRSDQEPSVVGAIESASLLLPEKSCGFFPASVK